MILAIYTASAPWLAGMITALYLTQLKRSRLGTQLLGAGVGGYLGCLTIIAAVWASSEFNYRPNNALLLSTLLIYKISVCSLILYPAALNKQFPMVALDKRLKALPCLLAITLIALLTLSVFQHLLSPAHGWDSLDFWSHTAKRFIDHAQSGSDNPFEYQNRHPLAVSLLPAWTGWTSLHFAGFSIGHWPWLLLWISAGLIVAGFGSLMNLPIFVSFFLCLISTTIPLFENQSLIPGYADLIVAVGFLSAGSILALSLTPSGNKSMLFLGLILSVALFFFKNTGGFYSILLLLSLAVCKANLFKPKILIAIALMCSVFLYSVYMGNVTRISVPLFGFVDFQEKQAFFFRKELALVQEWPLEIIKNQIHAYFVNLSFSTSFLFTLFSFFFAYKSNCIAHKYLATCCLFGIIFLSLSQLTDHGFIHAVPDNDTGNSRFTLAIVMLAPLLAACCAALAGRASVGARGYSPISESRHN